MAETGKKFVLGIGIWLIVKAVLNLILSFGFSGIVTLVVSAVIMLLLLKKMPYIQYIVAFWLALVALIFLKGNLMNISQNWIYLLEGLIDFGAAAILVFEKNVKAFFAKE